VIEILVTVRQVDDETARELAALAEEGLTGVRLVVKGRPSSDVVRDAEQLLELSESGVLSGPLWIDFPGVRPRVGTIAADVRRLEPSAIVTLSDIGGPGQIQLENGRAILQQSREGSEIAFMDGLVRLLVVAREGRTLRCEVRLGGVLAAGRSAALTGASMTADYFGLSALDLDVATRIGTPPRLSYVVSWVSSARQIETVHDRLPRDRVIPKLESPVAADELHKLMATSQSPMLVGRSDLSSSTRPAELKAAVDGYVAAARASARPAYVGSLILDSLETSETASQRDREDLEHLLTLPVDGLLIGGGSDPDVRRRKVSHIRAVAGQRA
jgi:pyruvate kinase